MNSDNLEPDCDLINFSATSTVPVTKSSSSSSTSLSDDWTVTNHGIDGDMSDGISVISDCNSDSGRHSPKAMKEALQDPLDETDEKETSKSSGAEDINSHTFVDRSMTHKKQLNFICMIFGALMGVAITILIQHRSEISSLEQLNQDLESDHLVLKLEVNRLVAEVTQKYLEIETMEKKLEKLVEIEITMREEKEKMVAIVFLCFFGNFACIFVVLAIRFQCKEMNSIKSVKPEYENLVF